MEGRRGRGKTVGIGIARPGVRVESIVLQVFVSGAVEVLRAGFGDNANLRARGAAVLGGVICSKDLHLLRGVHIRGAETGPVGARARSRGAVVGDQILRVARAVKIRGALAEAERKVRKRSAASTGH